MQMQMQISNKFRNLKIAEDNDINIPETLYIPEEEILAENYTTIMAFLKNFKNDVSFIVRSASSVEDEIEETYAGLFFSSSEINACDVTKMVQEVYKKNDDIKIKHKINCQINLILQRFIQCEFGGVIFTPWKYFYNHFLLEVSNKGPSQVVSGEDSQTFLLSKEMDNDILPLNGELKKLSSAIKTNVMNLNRIFDFPIDIEWGYSRKKIYIFQIRPVTSMPNAILNANTECVDQTLSNLDLTSKGHWSYTSLSESLGVISPLTFSLFKELFKNAKFYYNKIGYLALKPDFLAHLANGSVVVNTEKEKEFFQSTSFFSSFWRTFHAERIFLETINFFRNINHDNEFSFKRLSEIFGYWQIANIYFSIFKVQDTIIPLFKQNEYELSYLVGKKIQISDWEIKNWADARNLGKQLFLLELEKIKHEVFKDPILAFTEWNDFISKRVDKERAILNYNNLVKESIYNIPLTVGDLTQGNMVCIAGKNEKTGFVFSVENPHLFNGEFPDNCILIAPFFRNDWIMHIEKFKGIILESGGFLSHSAIVAREKNIVYFIHVKNAIQRYPHNSLISLIPKKNQIAVQN